MNAWWWPVLVVLCLAGTFVGVADGVEGFTLRQKASARAPTPAPLDAGVKVAIWAQNSLDQKMKLEASVEELEAKNVELRHYDELAKASEARERVVAAKLEKLQNHLNKESMADLETRTHTAEEEQVELKTKLKQRDKTIGELEHKQKQLALQQKDRVQELRSIAHQREELRQAQVKLQTKEAEDQKLKKIVRALASRLTQVRANTLFNSDVKLESQVKSAEEQNELLWKQNLALQRKSLAEEAKSATELKYYAAEVHSLERNHTRLTERNAMLDTQISALHKNITELQEGIQIVGRQRAVMESKLRRYTPLKQELASQDKEKARLEAVVSSLQKRFTEARASLLFDGDAKVKKEIEANLRKDKLLWAEDQKLQHENVEMEAKYKQQLGRIAELKNEVTVANAHGGDKAARKKLRVMVQAEREMAEVNKGLQMEVLTLEKQLRKEEQKSVSLEAEKAGMQFVVAPAKAAQQSASADDSATAADVDSFPDASGPDAAGTSSNADATNDVAPGGLGTPEGSASPSIE